MHPIAIAGLCWLGSAVTVCAGWAAVGRAAKRAAAAACPCGDHRPTVAAVTVHAADPHAVADGIARHLRAVR